MFKLDDRVTTSGSYFGWARLASRTSICKVMVPWFSPNVFRPSPILDGLFQSEEERAALAEDDVSSVKLASRGHQPLFLFSLSASRRLHTS